MRKFAQIKLTISILKQDNRYVAYSPALDLSSSGKTEKESKKRFAEAAMLLVQELDKAGTINEVFKELGWKQEQKQWAPPRIISQEAVGLRVPVVA